MVHEPDQIAPAAAVLRDTESRGAGQRPVFAHRMTLVHLMVSRWQWTYQPCVARDAHRADPPHSPAHPLLPLQVTQSASAHLLSKS